MAEAFVGLKPVKTVEPNAKLVSADGQAYGRWAEALGNELARS